MSKKQDRQLTKEINAGLHRTPIYQGAILYFYLWCGNDISKPPIFSWQQKGRQ